MTLGSHGSAERDKLAGGDEVTDGGSADIECFGGLSDGHSLS